MSESKAMNYLRRNIRFLITARGVTQESIARAAGMEPSNFSRFLNDETEGATVDRVEKIATALGVTASALLDENLEKNLLMSA